MGEGLGQVVVGPHPQAERDVLVLPFGREEQHRHVALLANGLAHPDAGDAGHHDIQYDEVQLRAEQLQSLLAAGSQRDGVALAGEQDLQQFPDIRIVVHDKDLVLCHCSAPLQKLLFKVYFTVICRFGKEN